MIQGVLLWGTPTGHGVEIVAPKFKACGINLWGFFGNFKEDDNKHWPLRPMYAQVGTWNPAKLVGVGDEVVPLWDLSQPSTDFLAWVKWFAALIQPLGIAPRFIHGDRCSEEGANPVYDPEYNNIQMFPEALTHPEKYVTSEGQLQAIHGGAAEAIELTPFMAKLDAAVYQVFKNAGCPIVYGTPKNEDGWVGPEWPAASLLTWEHQRAFDMNAIGYVVISSVTPPIKDSDPFVPPVQYIDKHGIKGAGQDDTGLPPVDVILDSDGANGDSPNHGAWGGHDLSHDQAFAVGKECKDGGYAGFVIISQMASPTEDGVQEYANIDMTPFEAACLGSGWTPPAPPPPPAPQPPAPQPPAPPAPTPVKHGFWYYIVRGNFKKAFKILFG